MPGAALRGTYTPLAALQPTAIFALCHGAAGNAELFIEAREVRQGIMPGLMLGLAGIGYFYLRFHDHATPSLLMVVPLV